MQKEQIYVCMRNPSRQHRGIKRFAKDMAILTQEANYADDTILKEHKLKVGKANTIALLVTIR